MNRLIATASVSPLRGQVSVHAPGTLDLPEWSTGEEAALSSEHAAVIATQMDTDGDVVVTVAWLTMVVRVDGATRKVAVTAILASAARAPSVHGKPAAQGADAEMKVSPGGVGSKSTTVFAFPGPAFATVSV